MVSFRCARLVEVLVVILVVVVRAQSAPTANGLGSSINGGLRIVSSTVWVRDEASVTSKSLRLPR